MIKCTKKSFLSATHFIDSLLNLHLSVFLDWSMRRERKIQGQKGWDDGSHLHKQRKYCKCRLMLDYQYVGIYSNNQAWMWDFGYLSNSYHVREDEQFKYWYCLMLFPYTPLAQWLCNCKYFKAKRKLDSSERPQLLIDYLYKNIQLIYLHFRFWYLLKEIVSTAVAPSHLSYHIVLNTVNIYMYQAEY